MVHQAHTGGKWCHWWDILMCCFAPQFFNQWESGGLSLRCLHHVVIFLLNLCCCYGLMVCWKLCAGAGSVQGPIVTYPDGIDGMPKISLPVFGLASYKFKSSMWTLNGGLERQLANSLLQVADNWLRDRDVDHPDFRFFASRGTCHRWKLRQSSLTPLGHIFLFFPFSWRSLSYGWALLMCIYQQKR